ncbi:unnamed protein product [Heligmosomoides polygyrus]|uniref:Transposase n=1 Tax=Heligmosomoides polygyrus TaxID=6339 RepID=A0A183G944_HELPZ|nr:unnamed protein product [Heligmosomoides polygyrus]
MSISPRAGRSDRKKDIHKQIVNAAQNGMKALDTSITGFRAVFTNHATPRTEISDRLNDIHKQIDKTAQTGLMAIDTSKRGFALTFGNLDYPGRKVLDRKEDIHKKSTTRVDIDWSTSGSCSATSITPKAEVSGRLHDIHRNMTHARHRSISIAFPCCERLPSMIIYMPWHGRRRVRHVYGSPCTVADVFGCTVADVFGTSTARHAGLLTCSARPRLVMQGC